VSASEIARALDAALEYRRRGWSIFPRAWSGEQRKRPLTEHGFYDATLDETQIRQWWSAYPLALVGVPTGRESGLVALDVDIKNGVNGFDTLADLGRSILPDTPMVHTASGGLHLHFDPQGREFRNSVGKLGPGLDVRGDGGCITVPSPGSGYWWDPLHGIDEPLAPAPDWLTPAEIVRKPLSKTMMRPIAGLSPYGEAALKSACQKIIKAPVREQEKTLHIECFSIGTLAGARGIPEEFARSELQYAASQIYNYDPRRPWRASDIIRKVNHSFVIGLSHPRGRAS
jgi:Bifunctional DNA primase/polymerase, N-terminal